MGIRGLHGLLKSIQKPCHVKTFAGQTLGVDAYGLLHRGVVACAIDLVLDRPTSTHIDYVLHRVRMLLYYGVTPYLVFDGDDLPSKAGTEAARQQRRQESKALGMELQRKGRAAAAYQEMQKAVDVTPYMARQLIEELKKMAVQYVVAPYEADAQLVYLERKGIVDGIISEDSDMLVFGAKRLISKLDQHGECVQICRSDFAACREVSFLGWTDADFRRMCILSGCDYLPNIPQLGLKTAYRCLRKNKNVERALRMIQLEGKFKIPPDYLQNFKQAELTFLYQRVFCPEAGKLVTLTPPESHIELEELTYIGADMEPEIAVGVASGDLDPTTKEPIILKPLPDSKLASSIVRRQTLGSSAELKPKAPITTFFTPKRRPLAELDPNTLTPSPSQQQVLARNANNSWVARLAPSRPSAVRSAPANRVSSPFVRSAERTTFLAQAARMSSYQPSKRQRLCSDTEESRPNLSDSRSRFFSAGDNASPIGEKVMRSKKPRKSTLHVFSDEVAEDIMSQIPDPARSGYYEESSTPCKSDNRGDVHKPEQSGEASQKEHNGLKNAERIPPRADDDQAVDDRSVDIESNPEGFHEVLDYHVEKQNRSLLSKFTFEPGNVSENRKNNDLGTQESQNQNSHTLRTMRSTSGLSSKALGTSSRPQRLTPLQRLGQSALSRSQSLNALNPTGLNKLDGRNAGSEDSKPSPDSALPSQGSEDMLVPDSEEEDDASLGDEQQPTPSLDLKRFAFAAK